MSRPTVGLAMIMQNERHHVPAAISQFFLVVDEIVVVDGGSDDDSVDWAKRMGATVHLRPFDNDFSAQKNFAISQLSTDWVYLTDPDERLEPTLLEILPYLVDPFGQQMLIESNIIPSDDAGLFDCFGIPRRNYIDGVETAVYPDYQYRLFKNYCRFEGAVHEGVVKFKNRTEVDFARDGTVEGPSAAPARNSEIDEAPLTENMLKARFNILHYKSSTQQAVQEELYVKIKKELEQ